MTHRVDEAAIWSDMANNMRRIRAGRQDQGPCGQSRWIAAALADSVDHAEEVRHPRAVDQEDNGIIADEVRERE